MRYELSDCESSAMRPMLPNKARGIPRVDDRRSGLPGEFATIIIEEFAAQACQSSAPSLPRCQPRSDVHVAHPCRFAPNLD